MPDRVETRTTHFLRDVAVLSMVGGGAGPQRVNGNRAGRCAMKRTGCTAERVCPKLGIRRNPPTCAAGLRASRCSSRQSNPLGTTGDQIARKKRLWKEATLSGRSEPISRFPKADVLCCRRSDHLQSGKLDVPNCPLWASKIDKLPFVQRSLPPRLEKRSNTSSRSLSSASSELSWLASSSTRSE